MSSTKMPQHLEAKMNELNQCHDIDGINNRFFSPFKGMVEMYALQKGVETGFELGFRAAIAEVAPLIEALESISNINSAIPKERHDAQWTTDFMRNRARAALSQWRGE